MPSACRIHIRSTVTLSPSDTLSPKQRYCRENWAKSLAKRNHEFEFNPLRQPVWLFLSLGGILLEKSTLPPPQTRKLTPAFFTIGEYVLKSTDV
jgi:hypothetical protein